MIKNGLQIKKQLIKLLALFILISLLAACARNPVTDKMELNMMSESKEISIGSESYVGQRQREQGDYIVDPELIEYVRDIGNKIASVSDRPLPFEFVIVNSSDFNAWALPGGKIGINRGLLVRLECESELAAILAHEVVHAAAGHSANSLSQGMLLDSARMASSILIKDQSKLDVTLDVLDIGGSLMLMKYGRDHELESDHYGMKYMLRAGFNPYGMLKIQEKMAAMENNSQSNWLNIMFATHPPSEVRVVKSREFLIEQNLRDKNSGCGEYRQAVSYLKKTAVAYENYDKALILFSNDKILQASKLLDKAIAIEPEESLFYGLRAQINLKKGKKQSSAAAIDKAVSLNSQYWQHYLVRGSLQKSLGNMSDAVDDFERSVALLPTKKAYYYLGELSLANNQQDLAVDYFSNAWSSETELGVKAGKMVARLDLNKNPQNYLDADIFLDDNKNIIIEVSNNSELPVKILEVDVFKRKNWLVDDHYETFSLDETIKSGESILFATSIGPLKRNKLRKYSAQVVVAHIIE